MRLAKAGQGVGVGLNRSRAEKAGGVNSRGNVAFSDLIRGAGADGKGGLGPTLRETQPFGPSPDEIAKIMYDTSIGGLAQNLDDIEVRYDDYARTEAGVFMQRAVIFVTAVGMVQAA